MAQEGQATFDKENIILSVEDKKFIHIKINDTLYYNNIQNLNIIPNNSLYYEKLETIIKNSKNNYVFFATKI